MTNLQELFGKRFVVRDDGTDDSCRAERVWCQHIPGKLGTIYQYGYGGALAVWTASRHTMKKLDELGLYHLQGHECALERSWKLPLSMFETVAVIVKSRKRRQLTQEQKEALVLAGAKTRLVSGNSKAASVALNGSSGAVNGPKSELRGNGGLK